MPGCGGDGLEGGEERGDMAVHDALKVVAGGLGQPLESKHFGRLGKKN